MIELLLLLPGFIHEKSRREGEEPKAILVVSRNFMHWKSSFLLHSEEAALKISEPAEAKAQTNQYNCKSNAVASSFFFNSISERQSKKQIHFCLHFPMKEQFSLLGFLEG